jgi:hypothetical protein
LQAALSFGRVEWELTRKGAALVDSPASVVENDKLLRLILVNQEGMQEKMIEIRVDLATMKAEVSQVRNEQQNVTIGMRDQVAQGAVATSLNTTATREVGDANALAHKEIWEAINKLTIWGRAVAITGSILVMTLSILTIVLELVKT